MSIYGSAVKKPITTLMAFVAIIVIGFYSLSKLPIDFYPEIEYPAIMVLTTYNGANAADIETNVSEVIENSLNSVGNLKQISSVSRDNVSIVTLEFEYGTDLDGAANDIRDALGLVTSYLPDGAEKPILFKFSTSMMPIMFFAVTAEESYAGIEKELEQRLINPLKRIDGIGAISLIGAPAREITVNIDPRRLEAYNLTIEHIGNIIRAENLNVPAGNIEVGLMSYPLRIQGEFSTSNEIGNIVLSNYNGKTIYLKDVATVNDSIRKMAFDEKINGNPGVRMLVMKQSGGNSVQIANEVNTRMAELKKNLPSDIKISTIFDTSEFISDAINNLSKTLIFAFIFVVLVVLFFLGKWRATLIIVLTIPISLIVAFIYLGVSGNTLNIISLSALSIAIGMVVDDAIVVLENISKHIEKGGTPREAAIYATNEVWLAVIATTLTIVAVFFPLTLVGGMTGIMFKQLGWIVTITVITSTAAAITLTPMLSSKLLKIRKRENNKKVRRISHENLIMPILNKLDNFYASTLKWALWHKRLVIGVTFAIFASSIALLGVIKIEFIPEVDEGRLTSEIELQSGVRVDETVKIARDVEAFLRKEVPELRLMATSSGIDDRGGFLSLFQNSGSNIINIIFALSKPSERERSSAEIADVLRNYLSGIPEVVKFKVEAGGGGLGASGNNVDVEIYGYDFDKTSALAEELAAKIKNIDGARDINISREKPKPELRINLDKSKMSQYGLNTATVATYVRNRVLGLTSTQFRESGNEYDVIVRFDEKFRSSTTDIENIGIPTTTGLIRLGDLASIEEFYSPPNIERKRRERLVKVSATPYKVSLGELAENIKAEVAKTNIPSGVIVDVGGAYEDLTESFSDLGLLLLLSVVLVYLVMASQFESLRMPLIIMVSIPFAFTGVFLALVITNTNLSIIAALGAIMLIGIVVKNAIVLVDYINLMRARGNSLEEAIKISGRSRLRPVLMTTATTILGMLPLALSKGEGSEIWSPMGIAVIGGLTFSTIITLIIIPVVYSIAVKRIEKKKVNEIAEVLNMNGFSKSN